MNALVLVGGQGTRLRPLTYEIPKPLLPIVGRPMIFEIVEWLASYGVRRVVFALGYQSDAFVEAFASGHYAGIEVITATEPEPRDTAGAIAFAADFAGVADERLIVVNGDILTDLDLSSLIDFHDGHQKSATIALTSVEDPSAYGVVPTDERGRVLAFIEKPKLHEAPTNMINAGTYILEPSVVSTIARGVSVSIEREIFPDLVRSGELYAYATTSYWLDTGTPDRYLKAQLDVLRGERPKVLLPEHCDISPGVFAEIGAEISGEIIGAGFFGANSRVESGASVCDSVVEANVVIKTGARLVECIVMSGTTVGANSVLERCIVGPDVHIGAEVKLVDSIIGARHEVVSGTRGRDARLPS